MCIISRELRRSGFTIRACKHSRRLPGTRKWRLERHAQYISLCVPGWHPHFLALSPGARSPCFACITASLREFHARSVMFLGSVVSVDWISMDPAKVPDSRTAFQ